MGMYEQLLEDKQWQVDCVTVEQDVLQLKKTQLETLLEEAHQELSKVRVKRSSKPAATVSELEDGAGAGLWTTSAVVARGLDIPHVTHVISYDLPSSIDEYVHWIGCTGRLGNKGLATAFFQSDKDSLPAWSLVKILSDAMQDVPDWLEEVASGCWF